MAIRNIKIIKTLAMPLLAFILGCAITHSLKKCSSGQRNYLSARLAAHEDSNSAFLFVLILTSPQNLERRNVIRQTWLPLRHQIDESALATLQERINIPTYNAEGFVVAQSTADQQSLLQIQTPSRKAQNRPGQESSSVKVIYKFVVGSQSSSRIQSNQLHFEQSEHDDLLILPHLQDSYGNLTQKLLMAIESITAEYSFKYVLKCDDDTYVKLDRLVEELAAYDAQLSERRFAPNPPPELYWGYFNGKAQIKVRGKWRESNFKSCDLYPPYALGGGYVISSGIAKYIAQNAAILSPLVSEDVSMGVWLGALRHVHRKHDVRFDSGYMPRKCQNYHLLVHKRSAAEMKRMRGGDLCNFEQNAEPNVKRPEEYLYDWSAPPSKCCANLV